MTLTYAIAGMTCGACQAQVHHALAAVPGVADVRVSLTPPEAVLTLQHPLDPALLAAAVKKAGYTLHYDTAATAAPVAQRSWLATYQPLLLIVGFILGGVLLREWVAGGRFSWHHAMNNFMGGFFVVFAFFKLLDLRGFAQSYSGYDLIAKAWFGWGYVYPFVELALGVLYFTGYVPTATNLATLALMLVGYAGVQRSLWQNQSIQCACLGTGFNLPMSTVTLIEDGGMALMAALMLMV